MDEHDMPAGNTLHPGCDNITSLLTQVCAGQSAARTHVKRCAAEEHRKQTSIAYLRRAHDSVAPIV